jgi:hypothetical protein
MKATKAVIVVPTYDRRHMPHIQEGKISAEVFCKNKERRKELGLKIIYPEVD